MACFPGGKPASKLADLFGWAFTTSGSETKVLSTASFPFPDAGQPWKGRFMERLCNQVSHRGTAQPGVKGGGGRDVTMGTTLAAGVDGRTEAPGFETVCYRELGQGGTGI